MLYYSSLNMLSEHHMNIKKNVQKENVLNILNCIFLDASYILLICGSYLDFCQYVVMCNVSENQL